MSLAVAIVYVIAMIIWLIDIVSTGAVNLVVRIAPWVAVLMLGLGAFRMVFQY